MDELTLQAALRDIPLGGLRFFPSIGSTNDIALEWADKDAPDFSLVIADEQTTGRGRMGRKWWTPSGSALAMSLILHPTQAERSHPLRTTGLLAVSLVESLQTRGLNPQIKWPNDVLLDGRKVAGILVESAWTGESLVALILGMGVNVLKDSVPPAEELLFPAISLEDALNRPVDRENLLHDICLNLITWRSKLSMDEFIKTWERHLAFQGQQVQVWEGDAESRRGELLGIESDGSLRLRDENGKSVTVHFGEVHLRPLA